MSKAKPIRILPPVEYLRECFTYNRRTGELRWRQRPVKHFVDARAWALTNTKCSGKIAGRIDNVHGYHVVRFGDRPWRTHRVIWKLVTGKEPPESIDHIDGDKTNNAWSNLRGATWAEQHWNMSLTKSNTTGYRGVYRSYKKWQAQIVINRKTHCLGTFNTAEEAAVAYEKAARKLHGAYYRETKK